MSEYARCPECASELLVKEFLSAATTGYRMKFVPPGVGLRCATCGARLVPHRKRVVAVQAAGLACCALTAGVLAAWLGKAGVLAIAAPITVIVGTIIALALLESRLIRFVDAPDDVALEFPLEGRRPRPRES